MRFATATTEIEKIKHGRGTIICVSRYLQRMLSSSPLKVSV